MLFNSHVFLFVFLPLTLLCVLGAARLGARDVAKAMLVAASLAFYAYWDVKYVALLIGLIGVNYGVARLLLRLNENENENESENENKSRLRTPVLVAGLAVNLGTLAYFKYLGFLLDVVGRVLTHRLPAVSILLPLGISFITFQKIAFLVDVHAGVVKRVRLLDYCLFVTFFPQLIAGPIVHHREMFPQLERPDCLRPPASAIAFGLALFATGLFKKVVLADALAPHANAVYAAAGAGSAIDLFSAWSGAVHYLLQLYFDFSGYSDMAIGLALLFGLNLPFNFASPYKALGFIDYWQRWHITLTRFLTAYVYNPVVLRRTRSWMAAGKKPTVRGRMTPGAFVGLLALPTLLTMFVSGLWHGAGFQFLVFGLLHGIYLVVEHGYRTFRAKSKGVKPAPASPSSVVIGRSVTLLGVLVASVFFRADSVRAGLRIVRGIAGLGGVGRLEIHRDPLHLAFVVGLILVTQLLPCSQELMGDGLRKLRGEPDATLPGGAGAGSFVALRFRPSVGWGVVFGAAAFVAVVRMAESSAFLYFNF